MYYGNSAVSEDTGIIEANRCGLEDWQYSKVKSIVISQTFVVSVRYNFN